MSMKHVKSLGERKFRGSYSERVPVRKAMVGESKTKQSMKNECDVNVIVKRYKKTGSVLHVNNMQSMFSDVSDIGDYRSMLDRVRDAEASFLNLPSKVRLRFNNDPGQLLSFVADPANRDEAVALGLAVKREDAAAVAPAVGATAVESSKPA